MVLREKEVVCQLVKKLLVFGAAGMFMAISTRARQR
jgi:hypothetical protein